MFKKGINQTIFTSEAADRLFSNITELDTPDRSFITTLRILLRNRLPKNETIRISCERIQTTVNGIMSTSASERMYLFLYNASRYLDSSGYNIHIIYTEHPDAGEKMLEIAKANAGAGKLHISDYTRRDDLQVFYARKAKALFFTNDAAKKAVIFASALEPKHFHALQMMIPRYLPHLFVDAPLTESEINLLKSTGNKSASEYEQLIEEFAKDLDFRAENIRSNLARFETLFERERAAELRQQITEHENTYNQQLIALTTTSNKMDDLKYTLAGLELAIDGQSEDSELMEYFICNKNLALIKVDGTSIVFVVHGYANNYDEDAFERYVSNHSGSLYKGINTNISKSQMEKLYLAIFSEGRYKLRMCAAYKADMRSGLSAISGYSFPPESKSYLPNPHIQIHGCIGGYAIRFQECMQNKDYVGAISQATGSASNLNFHDSGVIARFAANLFSTSIKCIERPDGTLLSPHEAINELEGDTVLCQSQ